MRDRLIELLNVDMSGYDGKVHGDYTENLADHLLAAGVIVPPCKMGDMVEHCGILYRCDRAEYYADEGKEPYWRYWATPINADVDCLWFFSDAICQDVIVLTKEEAEERLKERGMKNNVLRNWVVLERSDGHYVLEGNIYNDAKGRFKDGDEIQTSRLISINFMTQIAVTKNTEYYLGERSDK